MGTHHCLPATSFPLILQHWLPTTALWNHHLEHVVEAAHATNHIGWWILSCVVLS